MDPARYFERWFQSYCESERSHWLKGTMKAELKMAAYEAFNEGISFEKTKREDEDDLAND
ncbi:hypothetical protein [Mesorhizobium sp. KR9-304]|jgi:hypothetical protein|uniref:hypothetical protein n=1 Tax=Mesorhizobium sp. KR9-304 TaxID=3156614 RepID=UPI0032B5FE32